MQLMYIFSVISMLLIFSHASFADVTANKFSADELKSIRGVSQAILQVRGAQRRELIKETQSIRDEVKVINTELTEAFNELDTSVFAINASVTEVSLEPKVKTTFWQATKERLGWSEDAGQKSQDKKTAYRKKINQRLGKVKTLARRQKTRIDERMPSRWKVWEKPKEKDVRMKRIFSRLESELESLEDDKVSLKEKKQKLKLLMTKWNPKKELKKDANPQPTISSITKHIRKQDD